MTELCMAGSTPELLVAQEAVKICLGILVQLEDAETCIQQLIDFIRHHLTKPSARAALGAWEALMEAPESSDISGFLRSNCNWGS